MSKDGGSERGLRGCLSLLEDLSIAVSLLTWEDSQFGKQCLGFPLSLIWPLDTGAWRALWIWSQEKDKILLTRGGLYLGLSSALNFGTVSLWCSLGTHGISTTSHNYSGCRFLSTTSSLIRIPGEGNARTFLQERLPLAVFVEVAESCLETTFKVVNVLFDLECVKLNKSPNWKLNVYQQVNKQIVVYLYNGYWLSSKKE